MTREEAKRLVTRDWVHKDPCCDETNHWQVIVPFETCQRYNRTWSVELRRPLISGGYVVNYITEMNYTQYHVAKNCTKDLLYIPEPQKENKNV